MPEPDPRRQTMDPLHVPLLSPHRIIHHLDHPVIVRVPDRRVPIARNLIVHFRDGRDDRVGMEVSPCSSMDESDDIPIFEKLDGTGRVDRVGLPGGRDEPLVVVVLVVVAGDLLLE